jgi:hypothetical protein
MLSSSPSHRISRISLALLLAGTLSAAVEVANATVEGPKGESFMLCTVYDHEIFDDVIAWQEPTDTSSPAAIQASDQILRINRLKHSAPLNATDPADVFAYALPGPAYDTGLVPLGFSSNGPEIGVDGSRGYEVVYTKWNGLGTNWYHARQANDSILVLPGQWERVNFFNDITYVNRWRPFVTRNDSLDAAKVVYFRSEDPARVVKRLAIRTLEEGVPPPPNPPSDITIDPADETAIRPNDPDANSWGHWARIEDKDFVVSTYPDADGDQVVLYDPADPDTPIFLTRGSSGPGGKRIDGFIDFDPAADSGNGRYTLVNGKSFLTGNPLMPKTSVEVWQRVNPFTWELQYEFTSDDVYTGDPDTAADYPHVTSPEPFQYAGRLYIVFVVADNPSFTESTIGNILITRVEADDPDPTDNHYRQVSAVDPSEAERRKRTEPEIHYVTNQAIPVVFYSQKATANDPPSEGCPEGVNKLMRARTGTPFP